MTAAKNDGQRVDSRDLDIPEEPLAVSVLTGFLGSGKTTLLRHLLAHPAMEETAVIVNEFGEIGLDHLLVEKATEDTVLLNSGCLCCTVRGDLVEGMRDLYKRRVKREVPPFKRLIIETTGLADPAPILQTLMTDPLLSNRFRLDGVVTTVDAANGSETLDRQLESVKQAAVADRILLTKSDLVEEPARKALEQRLHSLNPAAPIYESVQGAVDPALLFNAGLYDPQKKSPDVQAWLKAEAYDQTDHGHHHHDVNRHDASIRAFCLTYDKPLDWDRFNSWVEMLITLYGGNILRIKGLLNVAEIEQPIVIHGVQHVFHPPVRLEDWPDDSRQSRIVFIVRDLKPEMFEHTLKAFNEDSSAPI
ncbi:GTP-binding protein [Pelagibius litoralis]|uniref:GTP-binding protein n=1 Tax=Pelagibius litoralis TaxID=374515 RepID=A0A967F1Z4_9PROT|nr:GTP-binding protein [Pelagibius litoralis]NIA71554.1 GTP-binding protein [Pelagibius litoralis]